MRLHGFSYQSTYQSCYPAWREEETHIYKTNLKSVHHTKCKKYDRKHDLGNGEDHQKSLVINFHGTLDCGTPNKAKAVSFYPESNMLA